MKLNSSHGADMSATEANIEFMNQARNNEDDSASSTMAAEQHKKGNKTFLTEDYYDVAFACFSIITYALVVCYEMSLI